MKLLSISAAVLLAFAGATAAAGQRSSSDARPETSAATARLTLTGCIQSADPAGAPSGAAGGSASSGSTSDPATARPNASSFVLANAAAAVSTNATRSGREVAGTTGSAAAPSTTAAKYALDGDNLAAHLNQQVEVTGTLPVDAASAPASGVFGSGTSSTAAPANTGAPRAGSASVPTDPLPKLRVQSIRVIAATCGQQ